MCARMPPPFSLNVSNGADFRKDRVVTRSTSPRTQLVPRWGKWVEGCARLRQQPFYHPFVVREYDTCAMTNSPTGQEMNAFTMSHDMYNIYFSCQHYTSQ